MDRMVLLIFQREVERQCRFSLIAFQDLDQALQKFDKDPIWYSIQNILISTGNISKILWPSKDFYARGAELRKILSIGDDSPLQPRKFRNHFEHFDERLEKWATQSQRLNFVDSNIGATSMIAGIDSGDFLRNFDPILFVVTFHGDVYNLKPIRLAVQDLWEKVLIEIKKTHYE